MKKFHLAIGIFLSLVLLIFHLSIIDDYGLTWDFHHHFFAGAKFLGLSWQDIEPRPLPYVDPDPRGTYKLPYGPFISIIPTASYLTFYRDLHWLAPDAAYNLPIIVVGVFGILFLYLFLLEAFNFPVALAGFIFIATFPRYFGDLHNNMKDVPMAAIFTLNIWLIWRLVKHQRLRDLILASAAFAIAFSTKVNSIFIPAIFAAWLGTQLLFRKFLTKKLPTPHRPTSLSPYLYFLFAPLLAFLLWWWFWGDPIGQLKLMLETFGVGTNNIEVLLDGKWYCSSLNVPRYYPYWYLAITTPLPILFFFLIGLISILFSLLKFFFKKLPTTNYQLPTKLLLLLWFFLPLTRYLVPQIGVIDGIRHFEEVVFPLAAIAAVGLNTILNLAGAASPPIRRATKAGAIILVIYLSFPLIQYHPFQITYFNGLVGGIKGAFTKYDLDYWGTSQKKAMLWLNQNAPIDSNIHIPMAADVAARYLRPDLLQHLNQIGYDGADYVVVLNRQSFLYRFTYIYEYILHHKTSYIVENQGVPLVWIFDNKLGVTPRQKEWWQGEDPCIYQYWKAKK